MKLVSEAFQNPSVAEYLRCQRPLLIAASTLNKIIVMMILLNNDAERTYNHPGPDSGGAIDPEESTQSDEDSDSGED